MSMESEHGKSLANHLAETYTQCGGVRLCVFFFLSVFASNHSWQDDGKMGLGS
jgi:hypothetical protein